MLLTEIRNVTVLLFDNFEHSMIALSASLAANFEHIMITLWLHFIESSVSDTTICKYHRMILLLN